MPNLSILPPINFALAKLIDWRYYSFTQKSISSIGRFPRLAAQHFRYGIIGITKHEEYAGTGYRRLDEGA